MKEGAAGQAGGSGSSGSGAGGTTSCAGLFCEDFESGSIDPSKWDTSTKGGTLAVRSEQVAHGKYALHLQGLGSGSDDWATLFAKNAPAALNAATTFGRASMCSLPRYLPVSTSNFRLRGAMARVQEPAPRR